METCVCGFGKEDGWKETWEGASAARGFKQAARALAPGWFAFVAVGSCCGGGFPVVLFTGTSLSCSAVAGRDLTDERRQNLTSLLNCALSVSALICWKNEVCCLASTLGAVLTSGIV